ncbi:MAG: hypothetical protein COA78_21815 [Blastopirellula sp.]|nr:MAG: hypothetical protein COA78_21815 [Blastopirellula sp.]
MISEQNIDQPNSNSKNQSSQPQYLSPSEVAVSLIPCPECNTQNQIQRKFCNQCGTGLSIECAGCGESNNVHEQFCGQCGCNVAERRKAQEASARLIFDEAEHLLKQGEYDLACKHLQTLSQAKHAGEEGVAKLALSRIEEIDYEKKQLKSSAEHFLDEAESLFQQKRIVEVLKEISQIPPMLRPFKLQKIFNEAKEIESEIQVLTQDIKQSIKVKKTTHLLPRVERLLLLKPYDESIRQLKEKLLKKQVNLNLQLKTKLAGKAKQCIHNFQYESAFELLVDVPASVRTGKFTQFYEQIRELVWLERDIHSQPYATEALLEIAKKLISKVPKDTRNLEAAKQIDKRIKAQVNNRLSFAKWKKPPEISSLGYPLQSKHGFNRIQTDSLPTNSAFQNHDTQMNVCAGLALQGLGLTKINCNLVPSKKQGMLGKLGASISRKIQKDKAWGIEFNDSGLNALLLKKIEPKDRLGNQKTQVIALESHSIQHKYSISKANIADRQSLLQESIRNFLSKIESESLREANICVNLESTDVIGRFLTIPPVEEKKLDKTIEFEVNHQTPFPLEDLEWRFHLWEPASSSPNANRKCVVVATRKEQLLDRMKTWEEAGISPHLIQCDQIALHNYLDFDYFQNGDQANDYSMLQKSNIAMLDVGTSSSKLIVSSKNSLWFRTISVGSDDFSKALVHQTDYSYAQADQLLKHPAQAESVSHFYQLLEATMIHLRKEIYHTLKHYKETEPETPINQVLLLGGEHKLYGLERYLQYGDAFNP